MSEPNVFPVWIKEAVKGNRDQMDPKSREFFEKLLELIPHFDQAFFKIPESADLGILKTFDPGEVANQAPTKSPIEFVLLSVFEQFHFEFIYSTREVALALLSSMYEGRFYVSALTTRAMLEIVCVNYFTFSKVEQQVRSCIERLKKAAKTRSKVEKSRLLKEYVEGAYRIFSLLFDANAASSISWPTYMNERFNGRMSTETSVKKINTKEAIDDLEKKSRLPVGFTYDLLSEFVHPNAGSKMLIITTRKRHSQILDRVTIGSNKNNPEAVLFYFDHLAEGTYYTFTLALTLFDRGQKLVSKLDVLANCG